MALGWTRKGVLEIALTVGGLMLAVLTYFAGVRRGKRYRDEDRAAAAEHEADHRIDRVVQRYALLVRTSQTAALHGLLVAGVRNLRSAEEVRLARERATAQTGIDPLRPYPSKTIGNCSQGTASAATPRTRALGRAAQGEATPK